MPRRYAGLSPSRVRTRIPSTHRLGRWVSLGKNYASVCNNDFPGLVASLFSWRCLAACTSFFLHPAMNFCPPSVTVSTHASAFNADAFQSPVMPNARMSLCTQLVHSSSFPPRPLRTAPSRLRFALAAARRSFEWVLLPTKVFSCETLSKCSRTGLSQGYGCTKSSDGLVSCAVPRWFEARPGGVRCEVCRSVLGGGSAYCIHTEETRLPRPLPFGSWGRALLDFRLIVELTHVWSSHIAEYGSTG